MRIIILFLIIRYVVYIYFNIILTLNDNHKIFYF